MSTNKIFKKFSLFILMAMIHFACTEKEKDTAPAPTPNDKGDYILETKYDTIRSYTEGGGNFIVWISPDHEFSGEVNLSLNADPVLNAVLTKTSLNASDTVAEVLIHPAFNSEIKTYNIRVIASHTAMEKKIDLALELFDWGPVITNDALLKRDEFTNWINLQYPLYLLAFGQPILSYATYPGILIVEHFTFLTNNYELRLCYHVMMPPYDWSKIRIRQRNNPDAEFAAMRETDGSIHTFSVEEYPLMFGY